MDQWIAHARADIEELGAEASRLSTEVSVPSDAWLRVPVAWRSLFQALRGVHSILVFFARPLFFGGGALLGLSLLIGSPPEALILNDMVLVGVSALILWSKHRNICRSWQAYLVTAFSATTNEQSGLPTRREADAALRKPPIVFSGILWASVGLAPLACAYVLSTRGSLEYRPHDHDYYVAPSNDSVQPVVTAAELRRRITAFGDDYSTRRYGENPSGSEDKGNVASTDEADQHDYNYSVMIRGLINGAIVGTIVVAWLVRWLDKRRW